VLLRGLHGMKAEQELSEMSYQMEEMSARLEEADGLTSAQVCMPLLESLLSSSLLLHKST